MRVAIKYLALPVTGRPTRQARRNLACQRGVAEFRTTEPAFMTKETC
jgi:hypothetical protein